MGVELGKAPPDLHDAIHKALAKEQQNARPQVVQVPTEVHLTVWGRARPSKRITGAMVHTKEARGYLQWQQLVAEHCLTISPRPLPWEFFDLSVVFYFVKPANEDSPGFGDYDNLRKAVTDGLAAGGLFPMLGGRPNDARIRWDSGPSGIVYCKLKKRERVEIVIKEFKMPDPVD